ncbi:hypothetical protein G7046_g7262 [Stylonectria norvegica]|nr:hypothetical protein G7046_g7262 [Stylonectria norvegica]
MMMRVRCFAFGVRGVTIWQRRAFGTAKRSLRWGPETPPFYSGTIPQHFASIVSAHGDRPAIIARSPTPHSIETTLTYHALDILSNRLASSLSSLGVHKGDRVAVSLGNGPEFAALSYAIFKLGAILVPLNPGFNGHQVQAALRHLGVEVLIIGAVTDLAYRPGRGRSNESLLTTVAGDLRASKLESEAVPTLKKLVVVDNRGNHPGVDFKLEECRALTPYQILLDGSERTIKPDEPLDPSDTINIQFTSGTTSLPKAAMLTHTSVLNNGAFIAHRMGLVPSDLIVVPPPLFHCFGCVLGYMASATTGSAILWPSPAFDPVATIEMCSDHDATGLYGVSTMLVAVLEALDNGAVDKAPGRLTKGIVAGSSVPESLMKKLYEKLGLEDLVICYGMTETSPVSVMTKPSDPFSKRTSSVGTVMPHTGVKIVDPHDRSVILPLNTRGELAAAGYLVMKGYYDDVERTAENRIADPDGTVWMYSGDEAQMDADGYVQITGRIKDLIIRGGENIHPLEVEDCLLAHDGVLEASVVGVPDARLGEAVAAFIIPSRHWTTDESSGGRSGAHAGDGALGTLSREEVREWVATKLSKHMAPKYVFWIEVYPKTASGKIQKYKLRELAREMLGEEEKLGLSSLHLPLLYYLPSMAKANNEVMEQPHDDATNTASPGMVFACHIMREIPELRRLVHSEIKLVYDIQRWDRLKSPQLVALVSNLSPTFDALDCLNGCHKQLPSHLSLSELEKAMKKLRSAFWLGLMRPLTCLLTLIHEATRLPDSRHSEVEGKPSSTAQWDAFQKYTSPVADSSVAQVLHEATIKNGSQTEVYGHFNNVYSIYVSQATLQPPGEQPTFPSIMEAWMNNPAPKLGELRSFATGALHDIKATQQSLSRLSNILTINVRQQMITTGIEKFDFAPWTAFHPLSLRKEDSEHIFSMWNWEPGMPITAFQLPYRLMAVVVNVNENEQLWLRQSPAADDEDRDWKVLPGVFKQGGNAKGEPWYSPTNDHACSALGGRIGLMATFDTATKTLEDANFVIFLIHSKIPEPKYPGIGVVHL